MMGLGAIIFGITFWLIVEDHRKRKQEKKWEDEAQEAFLRRWPAMRDVIKNRRP